MLYLHAYLAELKTLNPSVDDVKAELQLVLENLGFFKALVLADAEGLTLNALMDEVMQLKELTQLINHATKLFVQLERFTADLEQRHAQIIRLAKVRADPG